MEYKQEQIEEIKRFAALFFTNKQIAFMIGLPAQEIEPFVTAADDIYSNLGSTIYAARLTSEANIRKRIVEAAEAGSTSAQNQAEKFVYNLNFEK